MDDLDSNPTAAEIAAVDKKAAASARGRKKAALEPVVAKSEPETEAKAVGSAKRKPAKPTKKEPEPDDDAEVATTKAKSLSPKKDDKMATDEPAKAKKKRSRSNTDDTDSSKKKPKVEGGDKEKKAHRWKPGTVALREIRRYQKSTDLLTSKKPLERLIRKLAQDYSIMGEGIRFTATAIAALHEARDDYGIELLSQANLAAIHGKRVTIMPKDISLTMRIRGDKNYDHIPAPAPAKTK